MAILYVSLIIVAIVITYKIYSSYEKKVNDIINKFKSENSKFYNIAEGVFEVKTNGLKINKWNKEHKIDYVINKNAQQLILELRNYNDLKIWWHESMPKIKSKIFKMIDNQSSQMLILGGLFKNRTHNEINKLLDKYNPINIKFRLVTYTFYEWGEAHYNPSIGEITTNGSSHKSPTFYHEIMPDELYERIQFLSQFNFTVTRYEYDCKNQRALMTREIRHQIIERDKSICQNCGKLCKVSEIEIDHIKPISKGGKTILSNLQVLCIKCNRTKSNKWLESIYDFKKDNSTTKKDLEVSSNKSESHEDIEKNSYKSKNDLDIVKIKWAKVESSSIKQVYYNPSTKSLYIMFISCGIYVYYNVEQNVFIEFLSAPSKGRFAKNELDRYECNRVSADEIK